MIVAWAMPAYKLFDSVFGKEDIIPIAQYNPELREEKKTSETFQLMADYRDPFLGNVLHEESAQIQSSIIQRPAGFITPPQHPESVKTIVKWPTIKIGGMVNSRVLVVIGTRHVILSKNQEELGVKLLKYEKDSVWLKYSKEVKSFYLHKISSHK